MDRRMVIRLGGVAALGAVTGGWCARAWGEARLPFKASDVHPEGYPTVVAVEHMGAKLEQATGGRLGVVDALPARWRRAANVAGELLTGLMALFMVVCGGRLAAATWHNSIADFPSLSVGVTYLPIPAGAGILLLFVIERLAVGPPPAAGEPGRPSRSD